MIPQELGSLRINQFSKLVEVFTRIHKCQSCNTWLRKCSVCGYNAFCPQHGKCRNCGAAVAWLTNSLRNSKLIAYDVTTDVVNCGSAYYGWIVATAEPQSRITSDKRRYFVWSGLRYIEVGKKTFQKAIAATNKYPTAVLPVSEPHKPKLQRSRKVFTRSRYYDCDFAMWRTLLQPIF